ncbi:hypothetical protein VDG1235_4130 [Verrucomicrobiia bacterium DG1235]|nr:hypothetical protein VDG1235_4130 [Verrucomicrobiae bacterium DG1235]
MFLTALRRAQDLRPICADPSFAKASAFAEAPADLSVDVMVGNFQRS